jgi:AcrR family transcriptional regulator
VARSQDEIRNSILFVAKEYFARYGMSKTTVDDIAKAINMAKSSLYYYFTSKEDIFKAVLEDELAKYKALIGETIANEATPDGKLKSFFLTRFKALKQLTTYHASIQENQFRFNHLITQIHKDFYDFELELVTDILKQGTEQGTYSIENSTLTSKVLTTTVQRMELDWAMKNDESESTEQILHLLHLFTMGLYSRKS